jgi:hypothetical protein
MHIWELCAGKVDAVFRMVQSSLDWWVSLNGAGHLALVLELHPGERPALASVVVQRHPHIHLPWEASALMSLSP